MKRQKSKELTLEIWDNGHVVNAQLIDYSTGRRVTGASGKTEEEVYERLGDCFLMKAGIIRQKSNEKSGVF